MSENDPTRALVIPLQPGNTFSGISLEELWNAVVRFWRILSLSGVLILAVTIAIFFLVERHYRATTTIVLADQGRGVSALGSIGSQLGGLAGLAGFSLPNSTGLRVEALATLESRDLVRKFILKENLKPVLFYKLWDDQSESWDTESGDAPSTLKAIRFFQENVLAIERDPGSDVVTLSITWNDPELSERWANGLVELLNSSLRQRAIEEGKQSIEFLEEEAKLSSNTDLRGAVYALIEEQMAKVMLANVRTEYAFRVIDPAARPDADTPTSPRLIFFLAGASVLWILICLIFLTMASIRNREA